MKTYYTVSLAMLAGAALGATAVTSLTAQGKTPGAYAIVAFSEISDPAGFKENVVGRAPDIVKKAGGHFLARTDKITVLRAADPPLKRYVIIAFDNVQQAQTWYSSEDMKGLNSYTDKNTKGRAFVVEALPQ
jgi:uncharacterized protein (DUF1330 family)